MRKAIIGVLACLITWALIGCAPSARTSTVEPDLKSLQTGLHCLNEAGHNESLIEAVRQRLTYPETMTIEPVSIPSWGIP